MALDVADEGTLYGSRRCGRPNRRDPITWRKTAGGTQGVGDTFRFPHWFPYLFGFTIEGPPCATTWLIFGGSTGGL